MSALKRRMTATSLAVGLSVAAITGSAFVAPAPAVAAGQTQADFNGDGFADLAVGAPFEDVAAATDAGAVQIFYGSATGVRTANAANLQQDSSGVADVAETGDRFGSAVAMGNFNGDSYDDLAVGVPYENVGAVADAGAVQIFYGSASGLTTAQNQFLTQNTPGANDGAETGDHFGAALAAANLVGSSQGDLAVGVPLENVGSVSDAGAVHILRGSPTGLTTAADQVVSQNTAAVADSAERGDRFGSALAAADLAGSSRPDLAVGVPFENVGSVADAGAVQVLRGTTGSLTGTGDQILSQNTAGVLDGAETGDRFGFALVAADIAGSGKADLAVGVPYENVGRVADAGAVHVLRGSDTGVTATADQFFNQNTAGVVDAAEAGDRFGFALAAADLGGSVKADLAVGIPYEDVGGTVDAGALQVLPGSGPGVTASGSQYVQQSSPGSVAAAETGDRFGYALTAANLAGGSQRDVAVGVPFEDVLSTVDAGSVQVLRGAGGGVTFTDDQVISQSGTGSAAETGDRFGAALDAS